MKFSHSTHFLVIFSVTLFISGQATALTVYDVIQLSTKNYSDGEIEKLITATDSAFVLKAEDIPQLMNLGVSEKVIRTMLKAQQSPVPADIPTDSQQKQLRAITADTHDHDNATTEEHP